jgi:hypothetical protein
MARLGRLLRPVAGESLCVRIGAWAFCLLHNTQGTRAKREEAKGMRGGVVPIAIGILVLIILIIIISYL